MIDKLEAGKTYRLIDKEGWFGRFGGNKNRYEILFTDEYITLDKVDNSGGWFQGYNIIEKGSEYKYFELVEDTLGGIETLTRCQELAAEYNDSRFTVEYKQQVLESLIQLLTTGGNK